MVMLYESGRAPKNMNLTITEIVCMWFLSAVIDFTMAIFLEVYLYNLGGFSTNLMEILNKLS